MLLMKNGKLCFLFVIGLLTVAACYLIPVVFHQSNDDFTRYDNFTFQHNWHVVKNDPFFKNGSHVCLSVDDKTLVGAMAAINSIEQNTRYPVGFHILVTKDAYVPLRKWINNSILRKIHYEVKVFETSRVTEMIRVRVGVKDLAEPMNYARFYYAQYFTDLHGNAIHIDNDCIVQGDIHELHSLQIEEPKVAAFSDDCSSSMKRFAFVDNLYKNYINFDNDHIRGLGMNRLSCSFNTGVYVFNADRWRSQKITEAIERWMTLNRRENIYGNEKAGGGSQPPLMITLYQKYSQLSPMWNVRHLGMSLTKRYSSSMIARAKLLHWSGPHKPWEQTTSAPYSSVWYKYFVPDPAGKMFRLSHEQHAVTALRQPG